MRSRFAVRLAVAIVVAAFAIFELYEIAENPRSQLFGKTLVSGPSGRRIVALTYDDGPNPPYTERILAVLRSQGVHATFFVVGRAVRAYPNAVRLEAQDGDAIGNHTWSHGHLVLYDAARVRRTLERTQAAIYAASGVRTRIMRPPYGKRDWLVLKEVRQLGYTPVMWSVPLAKDWEYPSARVIAQRVLRYVHDGSIIDLHDGNQGIVCAGTKLPARICDRSADVEATRMIVEALKKRGYRFVTIPQLLHIDARAAMRTAAR